MFWRLFHRLCAVPLRTDVRDLHPSFQGPDGGLTFPMNGVSLVWFRRVFSGSGIIDIGAAFKRSLQLGVVVMVFTVVLSVVGRSCLPQIVSRCDVAVLRGDRQPDHAVDHHLARIALEFRLLDDVIIMSGAKDWTTAMGLFTSGLGAHLTWTLPFGLLIMFAIFNRFDGRLEEAARDLGATPWQTFRHVVLPIHLALSRRHRPVRLYPVMGRTRALQPNHRFGQYAAAGFAGLTTTVTNPDIYALGTLTSAVSFLVIFTALVVILILQARQRRHGSDAGKGMV